MALDFPTTPANGFVYTSPTGEQWTYETATNSWTSKGLVNNSGGIKYVGTLDITAAPPTGVTGGALYTVAADGTANAGFGPGVTGALTKGDSVMNTGTGWIKLSHPTSVWLKTGTNLAPTATGDVVNISAGTAALPGLTPVGDPDTGLFGAGANQLGISTNGTERVRIDSSGRLLVGTTSTTANGGVLQVSNGITFPATAVACTGTFAATGTYTKIGKLVTFSFVQTSGTITWTGASSQLGGFPFTIAADSVGAITNGTGPDINHLVLIYINGKFYIQGAQAVGQTQIVFSGSCTV